MDETGMEIHTLKMSITEAKINTLLEKFPPSDGTLENLQVRLTPEGVQVLGDYPTMLLKMSFETLWELRATGSVMEARLTAIKVSGLPASLLRGVLLKTIRDLTADEPGISVEDESIRLDLDKHTGSQKLGLRVNLTAVRCEAGSVILEAGPLLA
jgi:hypothetical protein